MNNDLLSVEDAFRAVLERCAPLPPSRVPLSMARGCCLAEDVSADRDSPPSWELLRKPYSRAELARAMAKVLAGRG